MQDRLQTAGRRIHFDRINRLQAGVRLASGCFAARWRTADVTRKLRRVRFLKLNSKTTKKSPVFTRRQHDLLGFLRAGGCEPATSSSSGMRGARLMEIHHLR